MLEDKIYKDYIAALKARESQRLEFLSFIRAEFKNVAIDLKKDSLDDQEALTVLKKIQKRLQETKESVSSCGRQDLLEKAESELSLLSEYMPELLGEKQLLEIIDSIINELGASSIKDMGRVMKEVLIRTNARADSKQVSLLVKNKLTA